MSLIGSGKWMEERRWEMMEDGEDGEDGGGKGKLDWNGFGERQAAEVQLGA